MFAKLAVTLVGLGLTSGALLVNRQHRIDVAVEIARAGDRLRREEASLGLLQAEVIAAIRPDRLAAALKVGPAAAGLDDPKWVAVTGRFDASSHGPFEEPRPR